MWFSVAALIGMSAYFIPGALLSRLLLRRIEPDVSLLLSLFAMTLIVTFLTIMQLHTPVWLVGLLLAAVCLLSWWGIKARGDDVLEPGCLRDAAQRVRRICGVIAARPVCTVAAAGVLACTLAFMFRQYWQPLTGYDVQMRWELTAFLASQKGHFLFYPPITDEDFLAYGLPDAMGLMVGVGYWWVYGLSHSTNVYWCAPLVGLKFLAVLYASFQLARVLVRGTTAGVLAALFICGSGVVTGAVLIGQECGILVLAALVLLRLVARLNPQLNPQRAALVTGSSGMKSADQAGLIVCMGLIAGAAAMTREYAGVYILIPPAGLLLFRHRAKYASIGLAAGVFALAVVPWLVYVLVLTGNPFYTIEAFGLLPARPALYVQYVRDAHWFVRENLWTSLMTYDGLSALLHTVPALFGFAWLAGRGGLARLAVAFAVVMFVLYVWGSFNSTGGFYYAYRVFAPGIAVGCVGAGAWMAIFIRSSRNRTGCIGRVRDADTLPDLEKASFTRAAPAGGTRQVRICREAAPTFLVVVMSVHGVLSLAVRHNYFEFPMARWPEFLFPALSGNQYVHGQQLLIQKVVEKHPERFIGKKVLTADLYLRRALLEYGVQTVVPWSPSVEPLLLQEDISPYEVQDRLRSLGIEYIVVDRRSIADISWMMRSRWLLQQESSLWPRIQINEYCYLAYIPPVGRQMDQPIGPQDANETTLRR